MALVYYGVHLGMQQNYIMDVAIHPSSVAPDSPVNGQLWYDTSTNVPKYWNTSSGTWNSMYGGTTWSTLIGGVNNFSPFVVGTGASLGHSGGTVSANLFNNNAIIAISDGGTNASGYVGTGVAFFDGTRLAVLPQPYPSGNYVVAVGTGAVPTGISAIINSGYGIVTDGVSWRAGIIPIDLTYGIVKNPNSNNKNRIAPSAVIDALKIEYPSGNNSIVIGASRSFSIGTSGYALKDFAVDFAGNIYNRGATHYLGSGILGISGVASGTYFHFPQAWTNSQVLVSSGIPSEVGLTPVNSANSGVFTFRKLATSGLYDVTGVVPSSGQALIWDGNIYVPGTVSASGGGGGSKYTATLTAGASSYIVTHNLNSRAVIPHLWQTNAPFQKISPQINHSGVNDLQIIFSSITAVDHDIIVLSTASNRYSTTLGSGATDYDVFHNFGTRAVAVEVWQTNSVYQKVSPEIRHSSTSGIHVSFSAVTTADHDVVILG